MTENRRIEWVDLVKGFAIILVVLGHLPIYGKGLAYIYTFHIPLFFFISGYLHKNEKCSKLTDFTKRKSKSILVPYIKFSLITLIIVYYINLLSNAWGIGNSKIDIVYGIKCIIYGIGTVDSLAYFNGALWFLPCLFIVEIIFYCIIKYLPNTKDMVLTLGVLSVMGYGYGMVTDIRLPWGIDIAFVVLMFYGFGYITKQYNLLYKLNSKRNVVILFLTSIIVGMINKKIDVNLLEYNNIILFYISAFSGIYFWCIFALNTCNKVKKIKILNYIGKETIYILALHLVVFKVLNIFYWLLTKDNFNNNYLYNFKTTLISLIYATLTILIILTYVYLKNKILKVRNVQKVKCEIR